MDNPKVVIQTDGKRTEIYVGGEKISNTTMIDFFLHAEPGDVKVKYEKYMTDDDGNILYNGMSKEHHQVDFDTIPPGDFYVEQ